MKVAVVGLGKIGLPLAVQIARKGVTVIGADIDDDVVDRVNAGQSPNEGEEGLAEALADVVGANLLTATGSTRAAVTESDVVVVVVPLIVNGDHEPDFSTLDAATRDIGAALRAGHLVCYETTVPVGTIRNRCGGLLEASGLVPGRDFHLAFSPERVFAGRVFRDFRRYPKLVGGVDPGSAQAAARFYESVLDFDPRPDLPRPNGVWNLGAVEVAELTKLVETTYRDVNIALANEFARFAERIGIDINPVIEAANSQPFSHVHRPGLVGGHCIPVYPHLYLDRDPSAEIPRAARRINDGMVEHVVDRLKRTLGKPDGLTVAVLGATYRGDVREVTLSTVFPMVHVLASEGARPKVHDPLYSDSELISLNLDPYRLGEPCDLAILHTAHSAYENLRPADLPECRLFFDLRGATSPPDWEAAGIHHLQLGRGQWLVERM